MTPVTDPFMAGVKPTGLQRGRGGFLRSADDAPYVTDPTGELVKTGERKGEVKRVKYGSPSNRGREIENDASLVKWKQRMSFLGIGMDAGLQFDCGELVAMDADSDEFKAAADKIAVQADKLTRSWLAADRGTHGHLICELCDRNDAITDDHYRAGEALGIDGPTQFEVAKAWHQMLRDNGLEILAIEASCVDDKWRLAGTLDRIVRTTKPLTFVKSSGELVVIPANTVIVLDLKFGKCRLAHPIQIASYAQSVPYDTETETRGTWPFDIDQTHALIAHGDFGGDGRPPSFELVWVDLVAGREHGGETVVQAKAWAARDDIFSVHQVVEGVMGCSPIVAKEPAPSTPLVGEGLADDLHPSPTPEVEGKGTLSPVAAVEAGPFQPLPSTPSPLLAATAAGEERVFADAPSPAMSPDGGDPCIDGSCPSCWDPTVNDLLPRQGMPQHALDEIEVDRLNEQRRQSYDGWGAKPDPARLALVQARDQLTVTPDEGLDLSGDEYQPQWAALQEHYEDIHPAARKWLAELIGEATRRGVGFHARRTKSLRVFEIYRGLISLGAAGSDDDEILRALLALVIGDVALFPGVHPGHAVGSLNAAEATRFADLVDVFNGPGLAAWIDTQGIFRLRELSPA